LTDLAHRNYHYCHCHHCRYHHCQESWLAPHELVSQGSTLWTTVELIIGQKLDFCLPIVRLSSEGKFYTLKKPFIENV
jgi:hypothetical protein